MNLRSVFTRWSLRTLLIFQALVALGVFGVVSNYWRDYRTPNLLLEAGAVPLDANGFFSNGDGSFGIGGDLLIDLERDQNQPTADQVTGVFVRDHNWDKAEVFRLVRWLPNLETLSLSGRNIEDEDTEFLSQLNVSILALSGTNITDLGLMTLAKNLSLRELMVARSSTTKDGHQAFEKLRPDVTLHTWVRH